MSHKARALPRGNLPKMLGPRAGAEQFARARYCASVANGRMKAVFAAFLAFAVASTASAKKSKVDFARFKGTYVGTYVQSAAGSTYDAQVRVKVSAPRKGSRLKFVPSGTVFSGGPGVPLGGFFMLGPGKASQQYSVFFAPSVAATVGTGRFGGRKNRFSFNQTSTFGGFTLVTSGTLSFSRKSMTFLLIGTLAGSTVTVTIHAKRKK